MKYFIVLLLISKSLTNVFCQEKIIKRAIEALNENNYPEFNALLNEYVIKSPKVPLASFALSLSYVKPGSPVYNLEKGFKELQLVQDWMKINEVDKSWCKSFGLCTEKINQQLDSIALTALSQVEKNKTDLGYQKFINTYTNTTINAIAIISYHRWKFEVASSSNTVESMESFIKQFPNAQEIPDAKMTLEGLEFNKCKLSNDISTIEAFIYKYPNSERKEESEQLIFELEYKRCITLNDKNSLIAFEKKFPNSKYSLEIQQHIEEIDFTNAKKSAVKYNFEAFIKDYPNSKYLEEVKKSIEELDFYMSRETRNIDSIALFIMNYPNSNFILEAEQIIEEIEFKNAITSANKSILEDFMVKYPNSNLMPKVKDELSKLSLLNSEGLVIISVGKTRELAIQNCKSIGINLVSNMYLKREVLNNNGNIISELISQNRMDEIMPYKIIHEKQIDKDNIQVVVFLTVVIDELNEFLKSKGVDLIYDKSSFVYKINRQQIKESQEIEVVYDMIGLLNEGFQSAFDYKLKASNPIKSNLSTLDWKVPLSVTVLPNDEYYKNLTFFINVLDAISMSENEINEYKKYSKEIFAIRLNGIDSNSSKKTVYLRNRNSLKAINLLFNNYLNFLSSFQITCEVDTLNGLKIEEDIGYNRYFYLTDRCFSKIDFQTNQSWGNTYVTKYKGNLSVSNVMDFIVKIKWENPIESKFQSMNNYTLDDLIYEIELKNLLDIDTIAQFNLNHFTDLSGLKKITKYEIVSNGVIYEYKDKGMVVRKINGKDQILLLNYFDKLPYSLIDSTFKQIPFMNIAGIRLLNETEYQQLFTSEYYKLLPLRNHSWVYSESNCYKEEHSTFYHYISQDLGFYMKICGSSCKSDKAAQNINIFYEK